jgi:hypothetical protein
MDNSVLLEKLFRSKRLPVVTTSSGNPYAANKVRRASINKEASVRGRILTSGHLECPSCNTNKL